MRKITADYLFPIYKEPIKEGVLIIDDHGKIKKTDSRENHETSELEKHNGFLIPGLVNSHCHLELSFMKDQIPSGTGLLEFVKQVVAIRNNFTEEQQQQAIQDAEEEMVKNGIVAVGDISNDTRSFFQKEKGNIRYHTFVEVFDLGPENTLKIFDEGKKVFRKTPTINGSTASITPHAPYSCTSDLYWLADKFTSKYGGMLSIHNQENKDENKLFHQKKGIWVDLFESWGVDLGWFKPTGKNSLESTLQHLKRNNKLVNIHNTFTQKEDIQYAQEYLDEVFWCFCPNANLYIENNLPDYNIFINEDANCTVGTDSYASNWQLSILEELKIIEEKVPELPLNNLLKWGTENGAKLLDFDTDLGSFKNGKKPGVNLVEGVDSKSLKLTKKAKVKNLVGAFE